MYAGAPPPISRASKPFPSGSVTPTDRSLPLPGYTPDAYEPHPSPQSFYAPAYPADYPPPASNNYPPADYYPPPADYYPPPAEYYPPHAPPSYYPQAPNDYPPADYFPPSPAEYYPQPPGDYSAPDYYPPSSAHYYHPSAADYYPADYNTIASNSPYSAEHTTDPSIAALDHSAPSPASSLQPLRANRRAPPPPSPAAAISPTPSLPSPAYAAPSPISSPYSAAPLTATVSPSFSAPSPPLPPAASVSSTVFSGDPVPVRSIANLPKPSRPAPLPPGSTPSSTSSPSLSASSPLASTAPSFRSSLPSPDSTSNITTTTPSDHNNTNNNLTSNSASLPPTSLPPRPVSMFSSSSSSSSTITPTPTPTSPSSLSSPSLPTLDPSSSPDPFPIQPQQQQPQSSNNNPTLTFTPPSTPPPRPVSAFQPPRAPVPTPPGRSTSGITRESSLPAISRQSTALKGDLYRFDVSQFGCMVERSSSALKEKQFTAYNIEISDLQADGRPSVVIVKRFSQLWALKHRIKYSLSKTWYLLLAPFPPKKWFDNDSPQVIAARCAEISIWLNSFNKAPDIYKIPFVKTFLATSGIDDANPSPPIPGTQPQPQIQQQQFQQQQSISSEGASQRPVSSMVTSEGGGVREGGEMMFGSQVQRRQATPSGEGIPPLQDGSEIEMSSSSSSSNSISNSNSIGDGSSSSSGKSEDGDQTTSVEDKAQRRASKDAQKSARGVEKLDAIRKQVLKEIITTEKSYQQSLRSARKDFEAPLREKVASERRSLLTSFSRLNSLCKESEIDRIFAHIHELIEVSEEFLRRAEPLVDAYLSGSSDGCMIGQVFIDMAASFAMFSRYVIAYAESTELVASLSKDMLGNPSRFARFMEELKGKANLQTLESLMITPIQRVPRYVLLLRELIKHTLEASPELEVLRAAKRVMQGVGQAINERKRQEEEFENLLLLDKCFNPPVNIAKRGRILLKHGLIQRMSGRDRIIYCYLHIFTDMMIVSKQHRPNDFEAELIWPFHKIKVVYPTDQASWGLSREIILQTGRAFYIRTPFELGVFFAPTPDERDEWLSKINEFINIRFSLRPV